MYQEVSVSQSALACAEVEGVPLDREPSYAGDVSYTKHLWNFMIVPFIRLVIYATTSPGSNPPCTPMVAGVTRTRAGPHHLRKTFYIEC